MDWYTNWNTNWNTMVFCHKFPHIPESPFGLFVENESVIGGADGQDARLGRVDDGGEVVDAHHTQVRNGESAPYELVRLKFPFAGPPRQLFHVFRNLGQTLKSQF